MGFLHRIFGEKLFGTDIDRLFAYATPRVAKIQDANLGFLRLFLMLLIFLYIVIFQILYQGKHFQVHGVTGTYRLQLQEPTKKYCNPMVVGCESNYQSIPSLPYCLQNAGAKGDLPKVRQDCAYFDAPDLFTEINGGHLIPTKMAMYKQVSGCTPSEENQWSCKRKYTFAAGEGKSGQKATAEQNLFVADVEHFTLLIDHAYHRDGGGSTHDDFMMQGYFKDCKSATSGKRDCTRRPIVCVHDQCKDYMVTPDDAEAVPKDAMLLNQLGVELAPPDFMTGSLLHTSGAMRIGAHKKKKPSGLSKTHEGDFRVVSIKMGDVLSIKNLLDLAGINSLDESRFKGTYRSQGMTLVVHIHYSNLAHWRLWAAKDPPEYDIEVSLRPTYEFQYRTANPQLPVAEGHDRTLYNFNGICIRVEQTGELAAFDFTQLLLILTTSLGLLAISNTLTDFLALSVLPKKEQYALEKYHWSKDFHDPSQES